MRAAKEANDVANWYALALARKFKMQSYKLFDMSSLIA